MRASRPAGSRPLSPSSAAGGAGGGGGGGLRFSATAVAVLLCGCAAATWALSALVAGPGARGTAAAGAAAQAQALLPPALARPADALQRALQPQPPDLLRSLAASGEALTTARGRVLAALQRSAEEHATHAAALRALADSIEAAGPAASSDSGGAPDEALRSALARAVAPMALAPVAAAPPPPPLPPPPPPPCPACAPCACAPCACAPCAAAAAPPAVCPGAPLRPVLAEGSPAAAAAGAAVAEGPSPPAATGAALAAAAAAADAAAAAESAAGKALVRTEWGSVLLAANHAAAGSRISFELFSTADPVEPTSFWFAVDEVHGSATYIRDIESLNVAWWQERVRSAKSARGGACTALDVGSNGGYFSILSRALGCRVLAVDAQPRCLHRLESAAAVNGFEGGVEVAWAAVAPEGSGVSTIQVGATKCSGLWAVKDSAWIDAESEHNTEVAARPLVEILREHDFVPTASRPISVMKIDVEGSEVNVLRSALPLLEQRLVLAIYAEVVPNRVDAITSWADVQDTFTRVYRAGYVCASASPLSRMPLEDVLRAFERVQGRQSVSEHWFCVLKD